MVAQSRWVWGVRGIGLLIAAAAWLGLWLGWTDEAIAFMVALVLTLPLAALYIPPRQRCLNVALGHGLAGLLMLSFALSFAAGRDAGARYLGPLFGLCAALAACGWLGRGRPTKGTLAFHLACLVFGGLGLTFVNGLDSVLRAIPEAVATSTLRRISQVQTALAVTEPDGYAADLQTVARRLAALPDEDPNDDRLGKTLANSRDNRFVLLGYHFTFRPGPRDAAGGIRRYELTAEPDRKRWRSFFVDQSGIVRNCPRYCSANASDPPA